MSRIKLAPRLYEPNFARVGGFHLQVERSEIPAPGARKGED